MIAAHKESQADPERGNRAWMAELEKMRSEILPTRERSTVLEDVREDRPATEGFRTLTRRKIDEQSRS